MLLWVTVVAANHRRSLHRPRPPCNPADLTLYVPPLLTTFGKFSVKPLQARLLDVQSAREGLETFERSVLEPALELAIPGFSGPPQRQGHRTSLLYRLPRIEKFFGRHTQSSSQLTEGAKVRAPYLARLDAGDRRGTHMRLLSQLRLGPHPEATGVFQTLAYVGHIYTSYLISRPVKAYHKLYVSTIIIVYRTKFL
jgi:hypothetical protein